MTLVPKTLARIGLAAAAFAIAGTAQEWRAAPGRLATRWATDVDPKAAWPEYPRPTLVRGAWQNLNGLWSYAITKGDAAAPMQFDGRILVPFAVESSLSGVGKQLQPDQRLWYMRSLVRPAGPAWQGQRLWLHFDAVDWEAEVSIDGRSLGVHRGGYDRFSFDVTDALADGQQHVLLVAVRDPSDQGPAPRGKQVQKPNGIWYTPCSGIWQTVWLEPVPATFVRSLRTTTLADGQVRCEVDVAGAQPGDTWRLVRQGPAGPLEAKAPIGKAIQFAVAEAWRPGRPARQQVAVSVLRGGAVVDTVQAPVARRHLSLGKDAGGATRLLLNGEPLFQYGPLDQGYWPDGLYTPPTFAAMGADLDAIAAMGCNMLRKHVKVESELYYDECDRRGILVWQDMPSGDTQKDPANFTRELQALVAGHSQHPSIVMWVVFNEGWGQHDTQRYVELVRQWDPTRWIGNASGWTDAKCGDVIDVHSYPGPGMAPPETARASVLGEFGGLGLPLAGHTWVDKDNWGYVSYADKDALTDAYVGLLGQLRPLIARGLSAAVYTQTTDVEIECNGWLTYDRAITKVDPARAAAAARRLYEPVGSVRIVVPTAEQAPQTWRWTTKEPAGEWFAVGYDDAGWQAGPGGFGTEGTPGARIGTRWDTGAIWLRRTIEIPAGPLHEPMWCLHHDEDVVVYIDGEVAFERKGYTTAYTLVPMARPLAAGKHVLAVRCKQTRGGQYIDIGISDLVPPAAGQAR
jgi:hypothetical protein